MKKKGLKKERKFVQFEDLRELKKQMFTKTLTAAEDNQSTDEVKAVVVKPETKSDHTVIGKRMKIENDEYTYTMNGVNGYIAGKNLTILSEPFMDAEISEDVELVDVVSEETGRKYICEFRETWLI